MTRAEAIDRIQKILDYMESLDADEEELKDIEALRMAIEALQTEPCEDAISRQAALDTVDNLKIVIANNLPELIYKSSVLKLLHELPSVQPEQKVGKWRHYEGYLTCSECDTEYDDDIMTHCADDVPRFCPNCGAKMEKEDAEC